MAGHHFSVQRIPRRFPRRIGPIAAAVALLGLAQPAWCIYNFTISNNTFPPTGTAPAVGSSVTQTVHVTLNGAGSVAIQSVVLQSAGWAGKITSWASRLCTQGWRRRSAIRSPTEGARAMVTKRQLSEQPFGKQLFGVPCFGDRSIGRIAPAERTVKR